jgi:hypothetical protein
MFFHVVFFCLPGQPSQPSQLSLVCQVLTTEAAYCAKRVPEQVPGYLQLSWYLGTSLVCLLPKSTGGLILSGAQSEAPGVPNANFA